MIKVGIDPDLTKSGVCVIKQMPFEKKEVLHLTTLPFFSTIELIKELAVGNEVMVVIEAGWLNNKSNFHGNYSANVSARIGKNVGENHAAGKLLAEAMEFYKIPYKLVRPTTEKWNAEFFKKVTKLERRTNAEERDALKLIWN